MTCQEAYAAGKEAYRNGDDVMNIPSHYSQTETELFILGYEEESRNSDNELEEDFEDEFQECDFFGAGEDELDFN